MTDIIVPEDLWTSDDEGVIFAWVYADGARVEAGKLVAELTVEKGQLELNAPTSGTLRILAPGKTVVRKGTIIGKIERATYTNLRPCPARQLADSQRKPCRPVVQLENRAMRG